MSICECESPSSSARNVFCAERCRTQKTTPYDIVLVAMAACMVIHFPVPNRTQHIFNEIALGGRSVVNLCSVVRVRQLFHSAF